MTAAPADPSAPAEPSERSERSEPRTIDDVAAVADTFVQLMRTFVRTRSKLLAAAKHDVEWSAHILLRALSINGPMRSSMLADEVESDPSTVSRQVAALVRDGLVERQADPQDGRATLLVLTPKADEVVRDQQAMRVQHFNHMLNDWTSGDLRRFAELLGRFTTAYDEANASWLLDKVAARHTDSIEGNN